MGFAVGVENAQGRVTMSHKSIDMDYERSMKQAENGLTELLKIENMVKPTSTSK